jgi:hypothetical protein
MTLHTERLPSAVRLYAADEHTRRDLEIPDWWDVGAIEEARERVVDERQLCLGVVK